MAEIISQQRIDLEAASSPREKMAAKEKGRKSMDEVKRALLESRIRLSDLKRQEDALLLYEAAKDAQKHGHRPFAPWKLSPDQLLLRKTCLGRLSPR